MVRKILVLFCLLVTLALLVPGQASACEICKLRLVCIADYCWVEEYCSGVGPLAASFVNCTVSYSVCTTSGDLCRWG